MWNVSSLPFVYRIAPLESLSRDAARHLNPESRDHQFKSEFMDLIAHKMQDRSLSPAPTNDFKASDWAAVDYATFSHASPK